MLALCLMLSAIYYTQNYAGIIGLGLLLEEVMFYNQLASQLITIKNSGDMILVLNLFSSYIAVNGKIRHIPTYIRYNSKLHV